MKTFEPGFYQTLFTALENTAVLMQSTENGLYTPIRCTKKFAELMECTEEEFLAAEQAVPMQIIHPDDRAAFAAIFKRRGNGRNHIAIRIFSAKHNMAWLDVDYAFFTYENTDYLYCNCCNVTHIKENEAQLDTMYQGLRNELESLPKECLAAFRINLSDGSIERRSGHDLFSSDLMLRSFPEILAARAVHYPIAAERERFLRMFSPENLTASYQDGVTAVSEVLYSKRQSGRECFVNCTAVLSRQPVTGEIAAFLTEKEYNIEKVYETMIRKILVEQYDMISYIVNGQYSVVIGDPNSKKKGSIFPKQRSGVYMDYIRDQVVTAAVEDEREQLSELLSPEHIRQQLAEQERYIVNVTCSIGGELYYKRFSFYAIDREAEFYILLKSDYTEVQREQMEKNEHLKAALREANQASVAKTAFLSRMSHEIRTPMNTIIGLDAIALQEPELPASIHGHLEKIGQHAQYLLSLINDILDMSRIESGRMTLKNEEFSFKEFLDQINTMLSSQCEDKGLKYDCFIHSRVDERYIGDSTKLKQVLINILGNAVKFTDAGGTICFHVERLNGNDRQTALRFVIEDTGIGMDQDFLEHIFEPFSQEDPSNTNIYGGSGLGLAISRHIITMMNGSVQVVSEKGMGSVFTVDVTLHNTAHTDASAADHAAINPANFRILVIDDDETACRHAQIVLEEAGFSSETCMTQEEALRLINLRHARREDFHLVLVDLRMPEHDGIAVTKAIRQAVGSDATVIILTAYNWEEVEEEARAAGVDGFMHKPLFSDSLLAEFQHVVDRKQQQRKQKETPQDFSGKRILLAEDVEINAEIMKRLLMMRNAEVEIAANGKIALDMFAESALDYYHAVLMDVRMPVMDGLMATQAIRELPRADACTVPIIAMTANAFDEDVQRSLQAGMDAHLSKPVDPQRLYSTLEHFLFHGRETI